MSTKVDFPAMKRAVEARLNNMIKNHDTLLVANVSKDQLWNTYLSSFPEGTNPIYKTRTEHDCNCCKQFVTNVGNIVTIKDGAVTSIWDILVKDGFQQVANALSKLVKGAEIIEPFVADPSFCKFGNNHTKQNLDGKIITWNHFFADMTAFAKRDFASIIGNTKTNAQLFQRGLDTITSDSIDTVLELINQNSLYRGSEFKSNIEQFKKLQDNYNKAPNKNIFIWETIASKMSNASTMANVLGIRNTVIGTLLVDISEGIKDLDVCVRAYEGKVAPQNYQRPTAIATKKMIEQAREKINQLGLQNALVRRYACLTDLNINNLLFVDRNIKPEITMDVFDIVTQETTSKASKSSSTVEEISIDDFVEKVLPTAKKLELLFEQKHQGNLVSLVTSVDPTAQNLFSWNNNFSWSYNGGVADSITERVKAQGGKVQGDLRVSLSWYNLDDLDLSLIEPGGNKIWFGGRKSSRTGGQLDVDMNAGVGTSRNAVENIIYENRSNMPSGKYEVWVHNFCLRENKDVGFEIEIEFDGIVSSIYSDKRLNSGNRIQVCSVNYDAKTRKFEIVDINSSLTSKGGAGREVQVWNIKTANFHRVNAVMLSPNYWNEEGGKGNKHFMFMLDQCRNEEGARGMYNEFLRGDLKEHRKVLEMVGCKMTTENDDSQLSGLGFSSTKKDSFVCRVTGAFTRTLKVNI